MISFHFLGHVTSHTGLAPGPSLGITGAGAAWSAGRGDLFGGVGLGGFVGGVCSWRWIVIEIQQLIYQ